MLACEPRIDGIDIALRSRRQLNAEAHACGSTRRGTPQRVESDRPSHLPDPDECPRWLRRSPVAPTRGIRQAPRPAPSLYPCLVAGRSLPVGPNVRRRLAIPSIHSTRQRSSCQRRRNRHTRRNPHRTSELRPVEFLNSRATPQGRACARAWLGKVHDRHCTTSRELRSGVPSSATRGMAAVPRGSALWVAEPGQRRSYRRNHCAASRSRSAARPGIT